ncbi:MAG: TauD/TfdA family dioxygenase [Alphaproteobacteria bacterium]|nr:TauD/TfdA family dioxygenase [Alphaproteobacteria bacterium]
MRAAESQFTLHPLSPALGAEIRGLDLRTPLSAAVAKALSDALDAHTVLLFRDQELSEADQLRLAETFGGMEVRSRPDEKRAERNEYARTIGLVTNIREDGKPIGSLPDGELWFHFDGCFVDEPYRATLLYAVEVPDQGGHTLFCNMYRAFEALDRDTRERLRGLDCLNYFDHVSYAARARPDPDLGAVRHARHPAVIAHPHNGRPVLYVSPLQTARIEGMEAEESEALLTRLFGYTENRDLIYEHVWRAGDLVIWDNWGSAHARTDFPADQTRLLRRSIVKGKPVAAADF